MFRSAGKGDIDPVLNAEPDSFAYDCLVDHRPPILVASPTTDDSVRHSALNAYASIAAQAQRASVGR